MRNRQTAIHLEPDALARPPALACFWIGDPWAMHQGFDGRVGQRLAPFGLAGDEPNDITLCIEAEAEKIRSESPEYHPLACSIACQIEQIFLHVGVIAKKENWDLPLVMAHKIEMLGNQPGHYLAEETSARGDRQTPRVEKIGLTAVFVVSIRMQV